LVEDVIWTSSPLHSDNIPWRVSDEKLWDESPTSRHLQFVSLWKVCFCEQAFLARRQLVFCEVISKGGCVSWNVFFFTILMTAIGGRLKPELCFLLGQLRWTFLPKELYSNSLSGRGLNTQPFDWEADTSTELLPPPVVKCYFEINVDDLPSIFWGWVCSWGGRLWADLVRACFCEWSFSGLKKSAVQE